jgi:hypothetical protein
MTSGFITLHVVGLGEPDDLHINPDLIAAFNPVESGSLIHFAANTKIAPAHVRETPQEIEHMLARLHIVVEGVTH